MAYVKILERIMFKEGVPLLSNYYNYSLLAAAGGAGSTEVKTIICGVLMCVLAVVAIALIVLILIQKSNPDDMSALTGSSSETYYNKSKEMTTEKKLKIATIVLSCVMVVSAIVFFIVSPTA